MIDVPGLTTKKKQEERYDVYVPLSATLNLVVVVVNLLPIYVVCKTRRRKRGRPPMDEIVLTLSVASVLFVVVPSAFQLIAFYNRSWHERQTICHFYQVSVGCLYFANMWLVTYACWAKLHVAPRLETVLKTARLRIAVTGIFVCALCVASIPVFVWAGNSGPSHYQQRCRFWFFQVPSKMVRNYCVLFAIFVVVLIGSLLLSAGGIAVVAVSTWLYRSEPRFKHIELGPGTDDRSEDRAVTEWCRIVISISAVLVVTWSFELAVFLLLRWDIVASDSVANYTLCSSTLSSIANPVIYRLLSLRYRLYYRQIFTVTSRLLFGCPITRYDADNDASHVVINSGGESDLYDDPRTTCGAVYLNRFSFSTTCSTSPPAGDDRPTRLPPGTSSGPSTADRFGCFISTPFDPSRGGNSSVNPCDYDYAAATAVDDEAKGRVYVVDSVGDWTEAATAVGEHEESGLGPLLIAGSEDDESTGGGDEDTEVESVDYYYPL